MSVSLFTTTTSLLVCTPAPVTSSVTSTFTETYTVTYPAACPTSEWEATYTVTEICTGLPELWTPPYCPPNFYTTTVICDICEHQTQVITCPNAEATATPGAPGVIGVEGNGITVTVEIDINYHPPTAAPAAPGVTGGAPGGAVPTGAPEVPGAGSPGSPAVSVDVNCPGCAPGAPAVTGFSSVPVPTGAPGVSGEGATGTGSVPAVPTYVTAGAPSLSLKSGFMALAGVVAAFGLLL